MAKARKPRAIGYTRVSTEEQTYGFGLDVQEAGIRDYAKTNGLRLVAFTSDEGQSGSNGLDTRPGLADALTAIEAGEAGALVVFRLDRLARDLILQETTIQRLQGIGASVLSVTEPDIDSDDETRVLVRQVLGAISQYERVVIRKRLQRGRERKASEGGFAYGAPPFGYRSEKDERGKGMLAPDPEEQPALKLMKQLRKKGASLREIAKALEDAGHLPRQARRPGKRRQKSGETSGRWHPVVIRDILRREGGE